MERQQPHRVNVTAEIDVPRHHDEIALARLGKRSVLQRNFGFMSALGLSTTIIATWPGVLT